jgi:type IV pilus assembly protein PilB
MIDQEVAPEARDEVDEARELAERLGLPFDPLDEFHVDPELFRAIPVEVMLRYHFLPIQSRGDTLSVVMANPSNVVNLNELERALARPLELSVGPASRIAEILEKSESTQRVLDEATEGFRLQLVQEAEDGEEVLSIDRITADSSPIIRLVDSVLFNAIQRRASAGSTACSTRP